MKTMLEKQLAAADDAAFSAPAGARLNGMPLWPMPNVRWVREAVCANCLKPVASMDVTFCSDCGVRAEGFKQRSAK